MTENEGPKARVTTAAAAAERAATAYRALADLAESVEDEWQYVNDLVDAYLPAIRALGGGAAGRAGGAAGAGSEGERPLPEDRAGAVDEAIVEIGLITDPHRAIDWLSTFPHVVALALDGDVDRPAPSSGEDSGEGSGDGPGEPFGGDDDDDNPFAALLRGSRR